MCFQSSDCTDLLMPSKYVLDVINNKCLGAVFSNNSPTMAPSGSSQVTQWGTCLVWFTLE